MTIQEIYDLAIKLGIDSDPRGKDRIKKILGKIIKKTHDLTKTELIEFDKENIVNPYSDTRYYNTKGGEKVTHILAGIDIEVGEVLLADRLRKEKKINLILSHHPFGSALSRLNDVMHLQADLLESVGIPINIAESLMEKCVNEVYRKFSSLNHYQTIDAAKLLNFPLLCVHTPADNLVYQFVKKIVEKANPETLEELISVLKTIPEYQIAAKNGSGPAIFSGRAHRRCGKIAFTEITGGTSGAKEIYQKLSQVGIGTIVSMHMHEEYRQEAEHYHLNVIVTGHIASDSIGMNLFLDHLEKKAVKIITTSGLIRIKR